MITYQNFLYQHSWLGRRPAAKYLLGYVDASAPVHVEIADLVGVALRKATYYSFSLAGSRPLHQSDVRGAGP